jgi:uncharacterized protein
MPAARASAAEGCTTGQTASVVPIHVRAPAEMLALRVADTITKRASGLMCVRALPARSGMIFVFNDGDNLRDFWMKNTLIPLDMLFVDAEGRIVNIHERAVPGSLATISAAAPVRAVIELNGGTAARLGIHPGDRVIFPIFGSAPR